MVGARQDATPSRIRVRVPTSLLFWACGVLGGWISLESVLAPGSLLYFRSNFVGGVVGFGLAFLTLPVLRWHAAIAALCSAWIFISVTVWSPENRTLVEASTTFCGALVMLTGALAVLQLEVLTTGFHLEKTTSSKGPPLI